MTDWEQVCRARKYEKGYPEDEAELEMDVEKLSAAGKHFIIKEASFEDSRRYYCLITL